MSRDNNQHLRRQEPHNAEDQYDGLEILDIEEDPYFDDEPMDPESDYYYEEDRQDRRGYDYEDEDDKQPRRKKSIGSYIISYGILVLILLVLFGAGYLFLRDFLTYKAASDEYALVKEKIVIPEDDAMVEIDGITYPDLDIDLDALLATNADFVGVLYIPALKLYYPVAHSHDNLEYLKTTFEGTYNPSGCIFLDANASEDMTDNNTFIYGHNMKNETMFGILKEFSKQEDLCATNPYFYLYLKDGSVNKYHIFAYYTTPVDDELYDSFEGDDAYDAYVERAQSRSYYTPVEDETDDFTQRPNLVTLSTCWGTDHKNNFVVQGAFMGKADQAVETTEEVTEGTAATAN